MVEKTSLYTLPLFLHYGDEIENRKKETLSNGLSLNRHQTVIVLNDDDFPKVSYKVSIKSGALMMNAQLFIHIAEISDW